MQIFSSNERETRKIFQPLRSRRVCELLAQHSAHPDAVCLVSRLKGPCEIPAGPAVAKSRWGWGWGSLGNNYKAKWLRIDSASLVPSLPLSNAIPASWLVAA